MINNIQFLRGLAALLVVFLHALPHFKAMNLSSPIYEFISKHGYIGVDIFFVISGFVMAKTTIDKPQCANHAFTFLKKRLTRIFLGYWPVFLIAVIYFYSFQPGYLETKEVLQSFLLINSNMYDLVIPPSWSLTFELYFYFLIGVLLLSAKIKPTLILWCLFILILIKNVVLGFGNNRFIEFFFSHVLIEFIGGYFLYYYRNLIDSKKWIYITFTLFFCSYLYFTLTGLAFGYLRISLIAVFSISLVWFFVLIEKHNIITFKGGLKKVGDASYTLYLLHSFLLGLFYHSGLRNFLVESNNALIGFCVYLLLIILISIIFYYLIEKPLYIKARSLLVKTK